MNEMSNQKPVYLIFGAAGGIGSELCRFLIKDNSQLAIAGRNKEKLNVLANETGASSYKCDATDSEQVNETIRSVKQTFGRIDGVVNCVGSIFLKAAHLTTDQEWHETMITNLYSSFYIVRAAAKEMTQTGGSIVLLSTVAARIGVSNHEAIAAAKAGVIGLTQSAAATYSRRGIRVNCVAPSLTDTPLTEGITKNESALKASKAMHALGRIGKPKEVASAIQWLLDVQQGWVTGQVIGVDGGMSTVLAR